MIRHGIKREEMRIQRTLKNSSANVKAEKEDVPACTLEYGMIAEQEA